MCPSIGELIALQMVGWALTTLLLTTILFAAGVSVGPWHLWAALLLFLVVGRSLAESWRAWLVAFLWLSLCAVVGGAALGWLYDFSGDGQWYHIPGVVALAQGWNPFHASRLADWNPAFEQSISASDASYPSYVYVEHYAKAAWIIGAAVYQATGLLEASKVFNLLYLLAVYLLAVPVLGKFGFSSRWAHILALAAAANPVALYQLGSFFVDGQVASLFTLVLLASLDYLYDRRRQTLFMLVAAIVLLANVKFTGVVFAGALVVGLCGLAWLRDRQIQIARYASAGAISLLLSVLLIGYQPYVTNLVNYGHPFYPALGRDDARNVQWHSAPAQFIVMNPVEKLVRSVFARSSDSEGMPQWKLPFSVSKEELYVFFNTEPRYGGFGPLFGSVLIVSLLSFLLAKPAMQPSVWNAGAGLAALVAATALLNPEAWWARLSPQLWLVPLILAAATAFGASGWLRRGVATIVVVLLGNSLLTGALNLGRAAEKNLMYREQLARLRAMSSAGPIRVTIHPSFRLVTELRLLDRSIPYEVVPKSTCTMPYLFSYPASAQAEACPSS